MDRITHPAPTAPEPTPAPADALQRARDGLHQVVADLQAAESSLSGPLADRTRDARLDAEAAADGVRRVLAHVRPGSRSTGAQ